MKNNTQTLKNLLYVSLCFCSLNTINAATTAGELLDEAGAHGSSAAVVATSAPATQIPRLTMIHIKNGEFATNPVRRGRRSHSSISLIECDITGPLDKDCFQNDSHLTIISLKRSKINFTGLEGRFGKNCPALQKIFLTDTQGITLKEFVENYASPDLLDLILSGICNLTINCAPEDVAAPTTTTSSGPTAAASGASSTSVVPVYTQAQIQSMIRAFRSQETTSTVWWLISTVTFGAVAAK